MPIFRKTLSILSLVLLTSIALLNLNLIVTVKAAASDDFVTTWKTDNAGSSNSTSITIPTTGGGYSYQVDWNNDQDFLDADETTIHTGDVTHDFGVAGTYTIRITGTFPRIYFNGTNGDSGKIIRIDQWGTNPWTNMEGAFDGTYNLDITATDSPNLSGVTSLERMFAGSGISTNPAMNNWNTSNITNMQEMFSGANNFNQNIGNWNTSNVTNMIYTFASTNFNQNIGGWNTGNVTNMAAMFNSTPNFNQNIGGWDTSKVTDMNYMFYAATNFNQNIGGWDTSQVNNFEGMFNSATNFNQNIGGWDTSGALNMYGMFFLAITFNQNIGNWDTSNVTDMRFMFNQASNFNQNISGWNTGNVTRMNDMFYRAFNFDQNLGSWNVGNIVNATSMLDDSGINPDNYSNLLKGWSSQTLRPNLIFGVVSLSYCPSATNARNIMINTFNWTLNDAGASTNCADLDADNDGVSNGTEDENGGDSNGDSIPDKTQQNVMQAILGTIPANVTFVATGGGCEFTNGMSYYNENTLVLEFQDKSYDYPIGLMSFSLACGSSGATTTVKIIFDKVYNTSKSQLRKNKSGVGFVNVEGPVNFAVENINGADRTTVTYNLTDGGINDDDGIANGNIFDPVGFGNPVSNLAATGMNIKSVLTWSISGLVLVLSLVAGVFWFRTRKV